MSSKILLGLYHDNISGKYMFLGVRSVSAKEELFIILVHMLLENEKYLSYIIS